MDINKTFHDKYLPVVKRIARRTSEWDDCEQEIWLNLWRAKSPANLRNELAFVIGVASKTRCSFIRRQSRSVPHPIASDTSVLQVIEAPRAHEPDLQLLRSERVSQVRSVLESLSDQERAIVDVILANVSKKEYCKDHGIKPHAANKRCRKLKSQLSKPLKELSDVCH